MSDHTTSLFRLYGVSYQYTHWKAHDSRYLLLTAQIASVVHHVTIMMQVYGVLVRPTRPSKAQIYGAIDDAKPGASSTKGTWDYKVRCDNEESLN